MFEINTVYRKPLRPTIGLLPYTTYPNIGCNQLNGALKDGEVSRCIPTTNASPTSKDLAKLNISLWVKVGRLGALLKELQETYNVTAIYGQKEWTQEELDDNELIPTGIEKHWHYDQFLFHPEDIPMQVEDVPEVFTVFRKKCEKHVSVRLPLPIPSPMPQENVLTSVPQLPTLSSLGYEEVAEDKRTAIPFEGGEQAAWRRLEKYFGTQINCHIIKKQETDC